MPEDVKKDDQSASADQDVEKKSQEASSEEVVDYKAELELERAAHAKTAGDRDNYRTGMLSAKDQLKKKGVKKDEEIEDEDSEMSAEDIRINELVDSRISALEKKTDLNTFDSMVGDYTDNSDEQALIKFHFENSVGQAGSIRDRIENAQLIANKKVLLKQNSELRRAVENGSGVSRKATAGGGNQDVEKGKKNFWSPEQEVAIKKRGLDPEKVKETFLRQQQG